MMKRIDGRSNSEIRTVNIQPGFQEYAEGSALIELGNTKIICAVTVEDKVPQFLKGGGTAGSLRNMLCYHGQRIHVIRGIHSIRWQVEARKFSVLSDAALERLRT